MEDHRVFTLDSMGGPFVVMGTWERPIDVMGTWERPIIVMGT